MPTRVEIHPTAKTAAYALGCSIVVVLALTGIKRLTRDDSLLEANHSASAVISELSAALYLPVTPTNPLVPVVELTIAHASMETNWSAALAARLLGQTEAPVQSGRVDVLTSNYAIEVDSLDKWHEGIGQAAHYGLLTKAMPVVALIVPSDDWPLSEKTLAKLLLIDQTCTAQNVKLILLRRVSMTSKQ